MIRTKANISINSKYKSKEIINTMSKLRAKKKFDDVNYRVKQQNI